MHCEIGATLNSVLLSPLSRNISVKSAHAQDTVSVHVWKLLRFGTTNFWQKFRESDVFTKEITKE